MRITIDYRRKNASRAPLGSPWACNDDRDYGYLGVAVQDARGPVRRRLQPG